MPSMVRKGSSVRVRCWASWPSGLLHAVGRRTIDWLEPWEPGERDLRSARGRRAAVHGERTSRELRGHPRLGGHRAYLRRAMLVST